MSPAQPDRDRSEAPELGRSLAEGEDLAWAAFLYYHGELSADESEAFEERLATEQAPREALAKAVELSESVGAAFETELQRPADEPRPAHPVRAAKPRRFSWRQTALFGTVAAACLAILVFVANFWPSDLGSGRKDPVADSDAKSRDLARAYAFNPDPQSLTNDGQDPAFDDEDQRDVAIADIGFEADLDLPDVPSWLALAQLADSDQRKEKP